MNLVSGDNEVSLLQAVAARQKANTQKEHLVPASVREDRLDRLMAMLLKYESKICDASMSDFGYRSKDQVRFAEVVTSYVPIKIARRNVRKWMRREKRKVAFPFNMAGAKAYIHYQPLGSVGIISPWNFPVNLTVTPLAGILAAGNCAMIKPSEYTAATSEVMETMFSEYFSDDEVFVAVGGVEVGKAFSALPFDHLLYTGGETVAKHVMRSAADNLVPVTLELGGKSPVVIGEGVNWGLAARRILFGKAFNAGQICLAPDHVYVPREQVDCFVSEMKKAAAEMFPSDKGAADYVSIINKSNAERVRSYIEEASDVHTLGPATESVAEYENMVPITLLVNPGENSKAAQQEVFGPILSVKPYDNFDDVVDSINIAPKPLALYYFGKNKTEQQRLIEETSSGGVTLNDVIMHYTADDLPFGGVGASGMGAYHGFDGFKNFSHARAIYKQSPFDLGATMRPPYGPVFQRMANILMKMG